LNSLGKIDLSEFEEIQVCDDMTLEELVNAKTLSEECKAGLEAYLPKAQDDFKEKLIVLGSVEAADGALEVYLYGANKSGVALGASDYSQLSVSVETGGSAKVLASGEFSVSGAGDLSGELLSVSILTDYSGSMSDDDLKNVALIENDIFSVLPPIYEADVTYFSTEVSSKQTFTSDAAKLKAAVAYDASFERDLTALYDGMSASLGGLVARTRPLKLLVVATDGRENSSTMATRSDVTGLIESEKVPVIMLGGLFSDPSDLSELAGSRGVYFYTPYYADARAQVKELMTALGELTKVTIPPESRGDGPVSLDVGDSHAEL
jgi:hypothetical protein